MIRFQFFKEIGQAIRAVLPTNISASQVRVIRANALRDYGHLEDALKEAEKARDEKFVTPYDRKMAQGKIVSVLNAMSIRAEAKKSSSADHDTPPDHGKTYQFSSAK